MQQSDFDVYNPHNHPAQLLFLGTNKNVVWNCNEPPEELLQGLLRRKVYQLTHPDSQAIKFIDEAVVADEYNKQRFIALYKKVPIVIPYGIDYDFYAQEIVPSFRQQHNLGDSFVLLHSGWFNRFKHPEKSFELFKIIKRRIRDCKLVYTGVCDSPDGMELLREIANSEYGRDVLYVGHVDRDCLRNIYKSVDLVVCPFEKQGGWLTPLEALSAGKLALVAPGSPSASFLKENNLGIVTGDFVHHILKYYAERDSFTRIIENAKRYIKQNLTWNTYAKRMLEVYGKAMR
jgi:glycosyltransferase involved in cell wall biosynthesis